MHSQIALMSEYMQLHNMRLYLLSEVMLSMQSQYSTGSPRPCVAELVLGSSECHV